MTPSDSIGPAVAGQWYPSESGALRSLVGELTAPGETEGDMPVPRGIVAPHAGFTYSGRVAGRAFRALREAPVERVILLGPSHYMAFEGGRMPRAERYRTPLGEVVIDRSILDRLAGEPGLALDDEPFRPEHSLESELPFLQAQLGEEWRLVPVLLGGGCSSTGCRRIADALARHLTPRTLVVASSDFTHYGPRFGYVPFRTDVPERIRALDHGAIEPILALDPVAFRDYVARTGATICGHAAIEVLLSLLGTGCRGREVAYDTSGRMTGDHEHSVSYAGLVFDDRS